MKSKVPALVAKSMRNGTERSPMLFGVDLRDAKEEVYVRMVTDGISMGVAFVRAGFKSKDTNAPYRLWQLPRIQERAAAILEARRTTGVVTLPQVTSMLQRVYSSAYHADEYNAAHNAALSLARLYGHVNDRQTLEVIRRPSRDPDAPSEQELSSWVESLPNSEFKRLPETGPNLAPSRAPAPLLATPDNPAIPPDNTTPVVDWSASPVLPTAAGSHDISNDINDLAPNSTCLPNIESERASDPIACDTPGRPENGAPTVAVTGTPAQRGRSELLDVSRETAGGRSDVLERVPVKKRGKARRTKRVPVKKRGKASIKIPSAKDLFG